MFSVIVMMIHAQMINDGEVDPRGGGSGVPFFDCAIHQQTN